LTCHIQDRNWARGSARAAEEPPAKQARRDANDPVGHGDCVHVGRAQIGVVTSATRSPLLNKNLALARVDITHSGIGTEVEIGKLDGHQKRFPARIVRFPHYDPEKTRVRA
jgi:aminomethyltransferase